MAFRMLCLVAALAMCDAFVVPAAQMRSVSVAASPAAAALAPMVARTSVVAMGAKAVKKPKKAVKKVVKKPVKKPVKKVVKKPIKKIVKKKAGKSSYALAQRKTVGGGTDSITGLVQELVGTLLTPTQLAFVGLWVLAILKFLIFYEPSE